ncbi:hypothetical protein [Phaeobacter porticola]|uniref:hypothetical protein n=1 Tax=Phaeobacter porticola TaxID=1844006 RepID=UPI000931E9A7|nr:hypothetical protein [Phaeobacter porticola]
MHRVAGEINQVLWTDEEQFEIIPPARPACIGTSRLSNLKACRARIGDMRAWADTASFSV